MQFDIPKLPPVHFDWMGSGRGHDLVRDRDYRVEVVHARGVEIRLDLPPVQLCGSRLDFDDCSPRTLAASHTDHTIRANDRPVRHFQWHFDESLNRPRGRAEAAPQDRPPELIDSPEHAEQRGCRSHLLLAGSSDSRRRNQACG